MTDLSINLNKIALIRNSRPGNYPSVIEHARLCIAAGADGITVHPRPDQRHIRARDCFELADMLTVEFNIEGNPFAGPRPSDRDDVEDYPGFLPLVTAIRPAQCTLVPDTEDQLTSDHGFDLARSGEALQPVVDTLRELGIRVCLFMDPDLEQIERAARLGVDRIELYTGPWAAAWGTDRQDAEFQRYQSAALLAAELGLGLNAGHDLNLDNLPDFRSLPRLLEVSIGHAFTVDALRLGLARAVTAYQQALGKTSP